MRISPIQNRRMHQLLNATGLTDEKASMVRHFTGGRSSSSTDMSVDEAECMISQLKNHPQKKRFTARQRVFETPSSIDEGFRRGFELADPKNANDMRKPMRGYIVHLCHLMGMIPYNQNGPHRYNYDKMNEWIVNIGANNPRKEILNRLSYYELYKVACQVEQVYLKFSGSPHTPTARQMYVDAAREKFGFNPENLN